MNLLLLSLVNISVLFLKLEPDLLHTHSFLGKIVPGRRMFVVGLSCNSFK